MGDAVDLLGLSREQLEAAKADALLLKEQQDKAFKKRPKNIPKEVFQLLSQRDLKHYTPEEILSKHDATLSPEKSIVEKKSFSDLKKKPRSNYWRLNQFTNPGRVDNLLLTHWEKRKLIDYEANKDGDNEPSKYAYAKFNRKVFVPNFSTSEFQELNPNDQGNNWTEDETRYLYHLCEKFCFNWFVIHDRWTDSLEYRFFTSKYKLEKMDRTLESLQLPSQRSLIELKSRYYLLAQKLMGIKSSVEKMEVDQDITENESLYKKILSRAEVSEKSIKATTASLLSTKFDFVAEAIRLENLDKVQRRIDTEGELVDHDQLVIDEINELDANIEEMLSDIKNVQKLQGFDDEITPEYLKRNQTIIEQFIKSGVAEEGNEILLEYKKRGRKKNQASLENEKRQSVHGEVTLRSERLLCLPSEIALGKRMIEKMSSILDELKIPIRPIPTETVVTAYDSLRRNVIRLIVLQKQLSMKKK